MPGAPRNQGVADQSATPSFLLAPVILRGVVRLAAIPRLSILSYIRTKIFSAAHPLIAPGMKLVIQKTCPMARGYHIVDECLHAGARRAFPVQPSLKPISDDQKQQRDF
jgi:hypothetical protein